MPIKYSCFISYKGGDAATEEARDFHSSLGRELPKWTSFPIFRDETRINGGDKLDPTLAHALCESACMVMIYTPSYFDRASTWCAREFMAMEFLESKRLKTIGRRIDTHGLIIPLVYRGWEYFPDIIKTRHSYNFESSVYGKSYMDSKEYIDAVKKIAEYISLRCNELDFTNKDLYKDCSKFELPPADESWLSDMLTLKQGFPLRRRRKS